MSYSHRMQKSLIQSSFFAPRGRARIYDLGMQMAQMYLSPYDKLIGFIGDAGSGKSALIRGMFPGLELTNDDDGVNVRPLPILDVTEQHGFYTLTPIIWTFALRWALRSRTYWRRPLWTPSSWASA